MQIPDDVIDDVRTRCRRAAGQVQAIERMLVEGRECREVVTQISAATKALEQAGFKLVAAGLDLLRREPGRGRSRRLRARRRRAHVHEAGLRCADSKPRFSCRSPTPNRQCATPSAGLDSAW